MNRMLSPTVIRFLTAAVALQVMTAVGFGSIVHLYESFTAGTDSANGEYLAGDDGRYMLTGQNPVQSGFSGAWSHEHASFELTASPIPSLSYTDSLGNSILTSGNAAIRRFNFGRSWRALDIPNLSANGTTTYFSFMVKLDDPTAQGRVEFGESTESNSAGLRIRSDGANFIAGVNFVNTVLGPTNTDTQLFVFKVDFGSTDEWSLWVNPSDLTSEGAPTLIGSVVGPASLNLTHLILHRDAGGTYGNGFIVDEIRVGSTWDAVAPDGSAERPFANF